jgi:hypothetical protein
MLLKRDLRRVSTAVSVKPKSVFKKVLRESVTQPEYVRTIGLKNIGF